MSFCEFPPEAIERGQDKKRLCNSFTYRMFEQIIFVPLQEEEVKMECGIKLICIYRFADRTLGNE